MPFQAISHTAKPLIMQFNQGLKVVGAWVWGGRDLLKAERSKNMHKSRGKNPNCQDILQAYSFRQLTVFRSEGGSLLALCHYTMTYHSTWYNKKKAFLPRFPEGSHAFRPTPRRVAVWRREREGEAERRLPWPWPCPWPGPTMTTTPPPPLAPSLPHDGGFSDERERESEAAPAKVRPPPPTSGGCEAERLRDGNQIPSYHITV